MSSVAVHDSGPQRTSASVFSSFVKNVASTLSPINHRRPTTAVTVNMSGIPTLKWKSIRTASVTRTTTAITPPEYDGSISDSYSNPRLEEVSPKMTASVTIDPQRVRRGERWRTEYSDAIADAGSEDADYASGDEVGDTLTSIKADFAEVVVVEKRSDMGWQVAGSYKYLGSFDSLAAATFLGAGPATTPDKMLSSSEAVSQEQ